MGAGKVDTEKLQQLERQVDRLRAEGQSIIRAVHDALGWAHEYHGKELPPPWRGVTALLDELEQARARIAELESGEERIRLLARRYGDESAFDQMKAKLAAVAKVGEGLRADADALNPVAGGFNSGLVAAYRNAAEAIAAALKGETDD